MGMVTAFKRFFVKPHAHKTLENSSFYTTNYLVIDLELTGLNPKKDEIVSLAWLPIKKQRILLNQAQHLVNNQVGDLNQSPIFHGIDSQKVKKGVPLNTALKALNALLDDHVLVFHNAELDWSFLKRAFNKAGLLNQPSVMLDTMKIEHKRLARQGQIIGQDSLTLANCRARYHLPSYENHNALTDAMATAELLLAQAHQIGRGKELLLKHLL